MTSEANSKVSGQRRVTSVRWKLDLILTFFILNLPAHKPRRDMVAFTVDKVLDNVIGGLTVEIRGFEDPSHDGVAVHYSSR